MKPEELKQVVIAGLVLTSAALCTQANFAVNQAVPGASAANFSSTTGVASNSEAARERKDVALEELKQEPEGGQYHAENEDQLDDY